MAQANAHRDKDRDPHARINWVGTIVRQQLVSLEANHREENKHDHRKWDPGEGHDLGLHLLLESEFQ